MATDFHCINQILCNNLLMGCVNVNIVESNLSFNVMIWWKFSTKPKGNLNT